VNPLIWIRLLAYGDRVVFERQRAYDVDAAGRAGALRSHIIGELRVALGRALAGDNGRHARGTVVRNDRSADGFLITTREGERQWAMQVSPSGTGVECAYGGSDAAHDNAGRQGTLQVSFPSQQLLPAVILESGVRMRCDTSTILCEQLLERIGSGDSLNGERRKPRAAGSAKRTRLERMRQINQTGARR
jgi:hypothetical protein